AHDPTKLPKPEGLPIPEEKKPEIIGMPIRGQDKDAGIISTPIAEQDKNAGILAGQEIGVGDWQDNVVTAQKPDYTKNKDDQMIGINGVQVPSKTLWNGNGKERIDVENPASGKRAGQIHYQDEQGNKYYYDPISQTFPNAP